MGDGSAYVSFGVFSHPLSLADAPSRMVQNADGNFASVPMVEAVGLHHKRVNQLEFFGAFHGIRRQLKLKPRARMHR